MLRMVKRGQAASRRGNAEGLAVYESAHRFYRAEAIRRGLVGNTFPGGA
jgi:hypothetical protein